MTRYWARFFLCALTCIAGAFRAAAQGQTARQYSFSGTVINTATGEFVKRAQIAIMRLPQIPRSDGNDSDQGPGEVPSPRGPSANTLSATTFSDMGGMFRFDGLPAGSYFINVAKPGFTFERNPDQGSLATLTLNSSVDAAVLRLSPLGVIEGKVTSDDGLPLRHVNIVALTVQIEDGMRKVSASRNVSTDDRGMYRLWNLGSGKYYIKAAGRSGGTITYPGDRPLIFSDYESFLPVYFGGANSLMAATPITIKPGSDEHADLTLPMSPSVRIRGELINFIQGESVRFELLNGDEDVVSSRVSLNQYSGAFQLQDVVPGSYILRATQGKTARGEVAVVVRGTDLDSISVVLAPAVEVRVVTQLANKYEDGLRALGLDAEVAAAGANPQRIAEMSALSQTDVSRVVQPCHPSLRPAGTQSSQQDLTPEREAGNGDNGDVSFKDVLPGTYRLSFVCFMGYVTSAQWAGTDLLANPTFTLQPGVAPGPIEVTARFGGGSLIAALKLGDSAKVEQPGVLLVPQVANAAGPITAQTTTLAPDQSDSPGSPVFEFASLAPGQYTAYAFASLSDIEYRNPEFLRGLAGGTRVEIAEGKQSKITLTSLVR